MTSKKKKTKYSPLNGLSVKQLVIDIISKIVPIIPVRPKIIVCFFVGVSIQFLFSIVIFLKTLVSFEV